MAKRKVELKETRSEPMPREPKNVQQESVYSKIAEISVGNAEENTMSTIESTTHPGLLQNSSNIVQKELKRKSEREENDKFHCKIECDQIFQSLEELLAHVKSHFHKFQKDIEALEKQIQDKNQNEGKRLKMTKSANLSITGTVTITDTPYVLKDLLNSCKQNEVFAFNDEYSIK